MTSTVNIHEENWVVEQLRQRMPEWIAEMGYPEISCQLMNDRKHPAGAVIDHPQGGIILYLNIYYFRHLEIDEIKAVVAHELGHVADDQKLDARMYEQRYSLNYYGEILDDYNMPVKTTARRHVLTAFALLCLVIFSILSLGSIHFAIMSTAVFAVGCSFFYSVVVREVYMKRMYRDLHAAEYAADAFAVAYTGKRRTASALRKIDNLSPYRLRWRHSRSHPSLLSRCQRIYLGR